MAGELTVVIRFEGALPMDWEVRDVIEEAFDDAIVIEFAYYEEDV